MSRVFVSGVKFSRAKPNSTGMACLQAGFAVAQLPQNRMHVPMLLVAAPAVTLVFFGS